MADHSGSVEVYSPNMDPRLILVLNEEAAVWSEAFFFFSSAHPFRLFLLSKCILFLI